MAFVIWMTLHLMVLEKTYILDGEINFGTFQEFAIKYYVI